MAFSIRTMFRRDAADSSKADSTPDPTTYSVARGAQNSALQEAMHSDILTPEAGPFRVQSGSMPRPVISPHGGDGFTVRELLAILPSQITRTDSLPMEQIVPLPLGPIQASLSQGRPSLRLSQIVEACPALFQRPLWPAEDMDIALPYQKACRLVDPGQGQGTLATSPFQMHSPPPAQPAQPTVANEPAGNSPVNANSPFANQLFQPVAQPQPWSGHIAEAAGNKIASPFEVIQPAGAPPPMPGGQHYQPEIPAQAQHTPQPQNSAFATSPFQAAQPSGQPPRSQQETSPFQMIGQGQLHPEDAMPASSSSPFHVGGQLPAGTGTGQAKQGFNQPSPFALASGPAQSPSPSPQPAWHPAAGEDALRHIPEAHPLPEFPTAVKSPFAPHPTPAVATPVADFTPPSPVAQNTFPQLKPPVFPQNGSEADSPFAAGRPQSLPAHNPIKQQPPLVAPEGLGPKSQIPSGMPAGTPSGIPSGMPTGPQQPWQPAQPAHAAAAMPPVFAPQLALPTASPANAEVPPTQRPQEIPSGMGHAPAFVTPVNTPLPEPAKQQSFLPPGFPAPVASASATSPAMPAGTAQPPGNLQSDAPPLPPILTARMKQAPQPSPKANQATRPTRPVENQGVPSGMTPPGMTLSPPAPPQPPQPPQAPQPPPRPVVMEAPPQSAPAQPPVEPEGANIRMSLASVLRGLSPEQLGFDPARVPVAVQVTLPLGEILPQLSGGSVSLPLETVLAGLPEKFRPAFARAQAGLRIPLPLGELFHLLPASVFQPVVTKQEAPSASNPFATLFGEKAAEDVTRNLAPPVQVIAPAIEAPQEVPAAPNAGSGVALPAILAEVNKRAALATHLEKAEPEIKAEPAAMSVLQPLFTKPVPVLAPIVPAEREPEPASNPAEIDHPAALIAPPVVDLVTAPPPVYQTPTFAPIIAAVPVAAAIPVVEAVSEPTPQAPPAVPPSGVKRDFMLDTDELGPAFRADQLSSAPPESFKGREPLSITPEPVASLPEVINPATSITNESAIAPPEEVTTPGADAPVLAPARPKEDLSFGYHEDAKQIALRAIFNTEHTLNPQEVVDLSSRFEGIRACLVITDHGVTHSGRTETSEEVQNFSNSSVEAYRNLMALAASLGMNQQGSFTLRSDNAVRSFFMEKGICLAVLHGEPAFRPGVRERLLLVAQELSQMLG